MNPFGPEPDPNLNCHVHLVGTSQNFGRRVFEVEEDGDTISSVEGERVLASGCKISQSAVSPCSMKLYPLPHCHNRLPHWEQRTLSARQLPMQRHWQPKLQIEVQTCHGCHHTTHRRQRVQNTPRHHLPEQTQHLTGVGGSLDSGSCSSKNIHGT